MISVANIREPFGRRFQTTGLDSSEEAHNLALLLRAGALAAPIQIVEERTVGPSLGQDNIDQGLLSVVIGFLAVVVFMAFYYRWFGVVANVVLLLNLVLIVAVMALLGATLTMPGIAGMVLTIGMAVDANVLIFERMREEIRNGNTPQASIAAGYDKALSAIIDAQRHHPDRRRGPVQLRHRADQGLRGHPDRGSHRLHVHRHHLQPRHDQLDLGRSAVAAPARLRDPSCVKSSSAPLTTWPSAGRPWSSPACSSLITFVSLAVQGLNYGLDFTGGTVIELGYQEPTDTAEVRDALEAAGLSGITVQHFGSNRDILLRIPPSGETNNAALSQKVFDTLAAAVGGKVETAAGGVRRSPGRARN